MCVISSRYTVYKHYSFGLWFSWWHNFLKNKQIKNKQKRWMNHRHGYSHSSQVQKKERLFKATCNYNAVLGNYKWCLIWTVCQSSCVLYPLECFKSMMSKRQVHHRVPCTFRHTQYTSWPVFGRQKITSELKGNPYTQKPESGPDPGAVSQQCTEFMR